MSSDEIPPIISHSQAEESKKQKNRLARIFFLFLIIFLAAGVYGYLQHNRKITLTAPITSTASSSNLVSISITKTGFIPAATQVSIGTQVTWINMDKSIHQVAADPYPRDDSIPGFNSSTILNKGDTISYTFETTGTYTFHDEKNPLSKNFHGTITVQ